MCTIGWVVTWLHNARGLLTVSQVLQTPSKSWCTQPRQRWLSYRDTWTAETLWMPNVHVGRPQLTKGDKKKKNPTTHKTKCTFPPRLWYWHHVTTLQTRETQGSMQQKNKRKNKNTKQNTLSKKSSSVIINLNTWSHQYPKGWFCNPRAQTQTVQGLQVWGDTQGRGLIESVADAKEAVAHERKRTHLWWQFKAAITTIKMKIIYFLLNYIEQHI